VSTVGLVSTDMASAHAPDVLVVGGGLAGWTAAVAASEQGRSVTLVERAARRPGWGNSMVSGGALHALLRDPRTEPAQLVALLHDVTDGHADPVVAEAWAASARRAVEWIEERGGCLDSDPTQPHRAKVFAPVRATEPGLRYRQFGLGAYLLHLQRRFSALGGTTIQPAGARRLERGVGNRWRVTVTTPTGPTAIDARSVVLADGGFQANRSLVRRYVGTDDVKLRAVGTGAGDGLLMGLSVGADTIAMSSFYGHLLARESLERNDLWPYPILDGLSAVGVLVDRTGARFVDEGYNGVTTTNALAWSADPLGAWLLIDDEAWNDEGRVGVTPPNPYLPDRGSTVVSASTLQELAARAGIDPAGLTATLAGLEDGTPDPPRTGVLKLTTPPFHALPVVAGVTFTLGGLRIDGQARVLDRDGAPIDGLFAAGGTAGGLHGGPRAGYAGGLLEAAVFGLIAGERAGCRRSRSTRDDAAPSATGGVTRLSDVTLSVRDAHRDADRK
jgi:succinate dehydrogenase/fumarate reductase flavoprotein subunit